MTVSLTPALSPRARGIRSALRATFTVRHAANSVQPAPPRLRLAIGAGVGAAGIQAPEQAFDRGVVERLAAAAIGRERLGEKHRERLGRGKDPLAMRGQHRFSPLQELRAGEEVEECVRIALPDMARPRSCCRDLGSWLGCMWAGSSGGR
jgi:hypothetical protein